MKNAISAYFDRRLSACLELLKGKKVYMQPRPSDHPAMETLYVEEKPAVLTYFLKSRPKELIIA
ncbi:MAG: hypothetical protein R2850_09845 [Bacteroidia bacterium]